MNESEPSRPELVAPPRGAAPQRLVQEAGIFAPLVGHVGDGNFHMLLVLDMANAEEVAAAKRVSEAMVRLALGLDGTCTGEHGIGYGKLGYLQVGECV
jgi:D-lactate dehydrogenase (cytochrome)